jgi:hypothetical protein
MMRIGKATIAVARKARQRQNQLPDDKVPFKKTS